MNNTAIKTITLTILGLAGCGNIAVMEQWSDEDIDGNGLLTEAEFHASQLGLRATFTTVDIDEDGQVTRQEYLRYACSECSGEPLDQS